MEYRNKPIPKVVLGLGFGDEAKGMTVNFEAEQLIAAGLNPVIVRYNGAAQAAHNVRIRDLSGNILHHTFKQFGSGSFHKDLTILNAGMLVDLEGIINEADALGNQIKQDILQDIVVDLRCPVIIPMYAEVNRNLETKRGKKHHGSTGRGVGIARACETEFKTNPNSMSNITINDLTDETRLCDMILYWANWCSKHYKVNVSMDIALIRDQAEYLHDAFDFCAAHGVKFIDNTDKLIVDKMNDPYSGVIFESSQGMLLDERYGWFPYVTYGDMTPKAAVDIAGGIPIDIIGVTRTYQTRHGFGPFPSEGTFEYNELDNKTGKWQGEFRTGLLDLPTLTRISDTIHPTQIALSCMDVDVPGYISGWKRKGSKIGHQRVPNKPIITSIDGNNEILSAIKNATGVPVTIAGYGPVADNWKPVNA